MRNKEDIQSRLQDKRRWVDEAEIRQQDSEIFTLWR
jgi:hypothetical protein